MNRYIIICFLMLSGCVNLPDQTQTEVEITRDSFGNVLSEIRREPASVVTDRNIELTIRECIAAENARYQDVTNATAQVALEAIRALRNHNPCDGSTNTNDVIISANNVRSEQLKSVVGTLPIIGGSAAAIAVGTSAVENRDATIVNQPDPLIISAPEPLIVRPEPPIIVEPFIVP